MARNYRKPASRKQTSRRVVGLAPAMFLAFVAGYITANVFDAQSLGHWLDKSVASIRHPVSRESGPKHSDAENKTLPKPKFEFYTLLSQEHPTQANQQILPRNRQLPAAETHDLARTIQKKVQEARALPPLNTSKTKKYDVQLASYNKKADAERLMASLLLNDYEAHIQEIHRDSNHWFRVIIGPYPSMREAEKAQLAIARSQHVMGIIRRQDA